MKLRETKGIRGALYRLGQLEKHTTYALRGIKDFTKLRMYNGTRRPSIAAVVVGRNDDYMPDFEQRLHAAIEWNGQCLVDEVIFIEWNPPPERELLATKLNKRFGFVRTYVVPSQIHQAICQNPRVPLLEFTAKNVGIRRAQAPWIVVTNADAAFGTDTVRTILRGPLLTDEVWTAQRVDIPWREGRSGEIGVLDHLRYRRKVPYDPLGTGEFAFASRQMWERIRGYDESLTRGRLGNDSRGTAQMRFYGAKVRRAGTVLHMTHPTSCTENPGQVQQHHGETATAERLPYHNADDWGLGNCREVQLAERVWRLEPPDCDHAITVSGRGND